MISKQIEKQIVTFVLSVATLYSACQKTGNSPNTSNSASITIVNAIPGSAAIIPVLNTGLPITYFNSAVSIGYGSYREYSPTAGDDTTYIVQRNGDTLDVNRPKSEGLQFYGILELTPGSIHTLFLTGEDTSSPDYLLTTDTIPYRTDSTVGIRFVNLSAGSSPISVNLEGNTNGSEVANLPYKNYTGFIGYPSNSTVKGYLFVVRDAISGDSLTRFNLNENKGLGLIDPTTNKLITFKNVTIALIGQPGPTATVPQTAILIDNY